MQKSCLHCCLSVRWETNPPTHHHHQQQQQQQQIYNNNHQPTPLRNLSANFPVVFYFQGTQSPVTGEPPTLNKFP